MAFDYFARAGADVAVIEAGLGGRLDSTNVSMPLVAGVTSIGLDHTEYLGSTLEEIAGEKAGIFKRGKPAVIGETDPHIRELLGAIRPRRRRVERSRRRRRDRARRRARGRRWHDLRRSIGVARRATIRTPLVGRHQASNLAFALVDARRRRTVAVARTSRELRSISRRVRIPGRFQHVGQVHLRRRTQPGGRRGAGADASQPSRRRRRSSPCSACSRDKDWREMIRVLSRVASRFMLTMAPTAPASRAWDLAEAAALHARAGHRRRSRPRLSLRRSIGPRRARRRCSSPARSTPWATQWRCCRCRRSPGG